MNRTLAIYYKNKWIFVYPGNKGVLKPNGYTYHLMDWDFRIYRDGVTNLEKYVKKGKRGDYLMTNPFSHLEGFEDYGITTKVNYFKRWPKPIPISSQKAAPLNSKSLKNKQFLTNIVRGTTTRPSNTSRPATAQTTAAPTGGGTAAPSTGGGGGY